MTNINSIEIVYNGQSIKLFTAKKNDLFYCEINDSFDFKKLIDFINDYIIKNLYDKKNKYWICYELVIFANKYNGKDYYFVSETNGIRTTNIVAFDKNTQKYYFKNKIFFQSFKLKRLIRQFASENNLIKGNLIDFVNN